MRMRSALGVNSKSKPLGTLTLAFWPLRDARGPPLSSQGSFPPAPAQPCRRELPDHRATAQTEESRVLGAGPGVGPAAARCPGNLAGKVRAHVLSPPGSPPPTGCMTLSRSLAFLSFPFLSVEPGGLPLPQGNGQHEGAPGGAIPGMREQSKHGHCDHSRLVRHLSRHFFPHL